MNIHIVTPLPSCKSISATATIKEKRQGYTTISIHRGYPRQGYTTIYIYICTCICIHINMATPLLCAGI